MNIEDVYKLLDETANMLRGMNLDPTIPRHAKDAMCVQIRKIEDLLEKLYLQICA